MDCVGFDSDEPICPEDMPYVTSKVEDDDDLFPKTFGKDVIRRAKQRRKKLKKRLMNSDECQCNDPVCAKPVEKLDHSDQKDIIVDPEIAVSTVSESERHSPSLFVGRLRHSAHVSHVVSCSASLAGSALDRECWNLVTPISPLGRPGGRPPPADEATAPKRPEEFELIDDNFEIQKASSTSSLWTIGCQDDFEPNLAQSYDSISVCNESFDITYCEESFAESDPQDCTLASEADLFEIFVCNIAQQSIESDEQETYKHNELFMEEEKVDEVKSEVSNSNHVEEEEMTPP